MSGELVEKLTAASQYGMCDGYWPKDEPEAPFQLYAEAAAELTRLRSEKAEKDAECKASMATIAAERERADKAEALVAELAKGVGTVLEWDKRRNYPVPYRVRDPLHKTLSRVSGGGK